MIAYWTDATLLFHTLLGMILAWMIWRAAQRKREHMFWRTWPPGLLVLWSISEGLDATIYGRRWLSRAGLEEAAYDTVFSFLLNLASLVFIAMLIHRINRGDVEEGKGVHHGHEGS